MLTVVPKFLATSRFCISASFPFPFPPDSLGAGADDEATAPDDDDASCWVIPPVGYSDAAAADAAALRLALAGGHFKSIRSWPLAGIELQCSQQLLFFWGVGPGIADAASLPNPAPGKPWTGTGRGPARFAPILSLGRPSQRPFREVV